MKKYVLIGVLGLVISWVAAYFGIKYNFAASSNVLNYVPNEFGQVFYLSVNKDLQDLLNDPSTNFLTWEYKDILLQIDQVAAYQNISWTNASSFIVAKVKKDFNFDKAAKIGFIQTWENYTYKDLGGWIYVYWEKKEVEYISNYKWWKIWDNKEIDWYINDITSNKYNVALFSKIDSSEFQFQNDVFSKYLKDMKYGAFVSHIGKEKNLGEINIIFNKDLEFLKDYSFSNALSEYVVKDTTFFLQLGNVVKMLWITNEQFMWFLGTMPIWQMMSKEDKDKLYNIFNWNIAAVIWSSDNILGVWAGLVFQSTDIYDLAQKYYPFLKDYVMAMPYFSGNTTEVAEKDKLWFQLKFPFMWWNINWNILLTKEKNAILNIFDLNFNKKSDWVELPHQDKSILNFYINFGKVIELYTKFAGTMWWSDLELIQKINYFKDKNLRWTLLLNGNTATLKFNLTK